MRTKKIYGFDNIYTKKFECQYLYDNHCCNNSKQCAYRMRTYDPGANGGVNRKSRYFICEATAF